MSVKFDTQRAKAIGRNLFLKYDIYKSNVLQPKQCYELFSDFCYRILNLPSTPTMEEANSMHQVMDFNKDKKVTVADFQNLAVRYLCGQGFNSSNFQQRYAQSRTTITTTVTTNRSSSSNIQRYQYSQSNFSSSQNIRKQNLTPMAQKRLDVVRRLFERFDKDKSGFLTEEEVPYILEETYKEMGQVYKPTKEDVKSYMKMVDKDSNGQITLEEFQDIVLESLKKAGFQIYQNQIY